MQFRLFPESGNDKYVVLAFGAHADDIELGCGGTLLYLKDILGEKMILVYVLFSKEDELPQIQEEARDAAEKLGSDRILVFDYPDTRFPDCWSEIKDRMLSIRDEYEQIHCIFTHFRCDAHQDHQVISNNTWRIFRKHLILEYEVCKYEGDLRTPNLYVPLSEELAKRKAGLLLECYPSRHNGENGHFWFTEDHFLSFMRIRGIEANTDFAEGFHARKVVCDFF